jgi:UDP-N-acetylmuramate--alanine ligase
MGAYDPKSEYFVYECDEFDRNFLAFHPHLSIIAGVGYDHHEIYPTLENYQAAFKDFIDQSRQTVLWEEDAKKLQLLGTANTEIETYSDPRIEQVGIAGLYNRRDAWLVIKAVSQLTNEPMDKLTQLMDRFPGVSRRFERIVDNLYSDDAHTPEKIMGCMSVARELSGKTGQKIVVIYEPLTNRRMHYLGAEHHSVFDGAAEIYWIPSYLAREDPALAVLSPEELLQHLRSDLQQIAKPMQRDDKLKGLIDEHLKNGDMVVAMAGGGAGSLDEWLREKFSPGKNT